MAVPEFSDLTVYYNNHDLLLETVKQLQKDFSEVSISIPFNGSEPNPYHYLINVLTPLLAELLDTRTEKLMNLLYRIDISERQVSGAIAGAVGEAAGNLAHLLLERELKKVLLRNYFKNR